MARISTVILGYRKGKVEISDRGKLANTCLKLNIPIDVTYDGDFVIRERDGKRFETYAKHRFKYSLSGPMGIYGQIYRLRERLGAIIAAVLIAVISVLTSDMVWDVRISGNERVSEEVILSALKDSGFEIGSSWMKTDKNAVEADLLSETPEIAWISINRRGTVAYVEVLESENIGIQPEHTPICSNIVADKDGVIEEISVVSGAAVVKVGDVVKKGDVLISGIVESEYGSYFCRADGTVRAQSVDNISVEVSRKYTKRVQTDEKLVHARLVLFKFSINIFKNYGNYAGACDIIEKIKDFSLYGDRRLPLRICRTYICEYDEIDATRSQDEMIEVARRELDEMISAALKNADVIKLRTDGNFKEDVYVLTSRVVYSTNIGVEQEIEIS